MLNTTKTLMLWFMLLAVFTFSSCSEKCGGKEYNPETQFCDSRDKKLYKFIAIGEQTWMAENLGYDNEGGKCYDNDPANCEKYGRLYNWAAAIKVCPEGWHLPNKDEWDELFRYADKINGAENPYGVSVADGNLKAKEGWAWTQVSGVDKYKVPNNGEDKYGFAALPGGAGWAGGDFDDIGYFGNWWSTAESEIELFRSCPDPIDEEENFHGCLRKPADGSPTSEAFARVLSAYDRYKPSSWYIKHKSLYLSVRCVKD